MASGHRKRKAAALRIEVLDPAGITNLPASERGNTTNLNNLVNIATYSRDGVSPTFTAGAATQLSNAISNADGTYTKAGLSGEVTNVGTFTGTSMSGAIGLQNGSTKHYYFPALGGTQTVLSGATAVNPPVIIYSPEGPQAGYVPFYLGGNQTTASIRFGTKITGSGEPTHVVVYVAGELTSGSAGEDRVRILKASDSTLFNAKIMTGSDTAVPAAAVNTSTSASATELSSALYRKAFLIQTGAIGAVGGMIIEFSSSAKTSTTPVAGVFVVISSGSY